jgi:hypothetical protein
LSLPVTRRRKPHKPHCHRRHSSFPLHTSFIPLSLLPLSLSQRGLNLSLFFLAESLHFSLSRNHQSPSNTISLSLYFFTIPIWLPVQSCRTKKYMNDKKMHIFIFLFQPLKKNN